MTAAHDTQALAAMTPCGDCGMPCRPTDYHPMAACLMFKACHDSAQVTANLQAVHEHALASRLQEQEGQPALSERLNSEGIGDLIFAMERWKSARTGDASTSALNALEALIVRLAATLAAGSQAVQVPGWRPIETAPKDGTQIDVWIGDEREPDVFWGTPKLGHRAPCWCRHVYDSCFGWIPESVGIPSHWMSKPIQPLAGGEVGNG